MQHCYMAQPMSWESIERVAENVRKTLGFIEKPYFPVFDVLEYILDRELGLISFEIESVSSMGNAEGYTDPNGRFIILGDDVYRKGVSGQPRARFTAAHELGHLYLHTNVPLARVPTGYQPKPYELCEAQANQFAGAVLMPKDFITASDTVEKISARHGVSTQAAELRFNYLRNKGYLMKQGRSGCNRSALYGIR